MRFDRGANAGVHLARASMRKHLLLEARQRCRDNLTQSSRIRGLKKSGVRPLHSKGRCGDQKHSCELVSIRG